LVTLFDPRGCAFPRPCRRAVLAQANLNAPIRIDVPALQSAIQAKRALMIPGRGHAYARHARSPRPAGSSRAHAEPIREGLDRHRPVRSLAIPQSAVLRRSEVTAVYMLDAKGDAHLRQVRLGEPPAAAWSKSSRASMQGERVAIEPIRAGIEASRGGNRRS
jgi:hypothetical protein